MSMYSFLDRVSDQHPHCCLMSECSDEDCELKIEDWAIPPLVVVGGTQYQQNHNHKGPLCDFTLFGTTPTSFVCAVEMKGGHNLDAKHAVDQIQAGLAIAESYSTKEEIDHWFPILLRHDGAGNSWDKRFLASSKAFVRFHGERLRVEMHDCGSRLTDILSFALTDKS